MTTDTIAMAVRQTIADLTADQAESPVELLFVGEHSVWLVVAPDRIESEEAIIDVFREIESIPGVKTLYVERDDTTRAALP
ncbi:MULTISPECIES: hypothetical protein [unclassified Halorhabdus]|uniref:hypothetical protein n=1 Tax=unclassified Halorhabdus TaxID=2621901 RepID=UPI0023D9C9D5|nr:MULTISPECIES: hypothetical protein [unclassified Halorhabdus]WEL17544.1 hypothetical protein SVXHr_1375 [Halorhabdus sp. SVX81]WEL21426.1 hypothetical protein HBNXHr_1363 [Halorhabdus sp. BNX81]